MKTQSLFLLLSIGLLATNALPAHAQNDRDEILKLRNESNAVLKNYDLNSYLSFLTEDVHYTISTGTLINGKDNLREYLTQRTGAKMYWLRTPTEVDVNTQQGLAWETGTWKGFTELQEKSVTGGKYSTLWIKINGSWKIKSQLFVKLE